MPYRREWRPIGRRQSLTIMLAALTLGLQASPARGAQNQSAQGQRHVCTDPGCSPYIYDPAVGDPTLGIPPGTAFRDLPSDWTCPDCGASKRRFVPLGDDARG